MHRGDEMTKALIGALAVIDEADATLTGSDGRPPADHKSLGDRYIYLRFKHGCGQPVTYVRVKAG
jgi:hypothetical protein